MIEPPSTVHADTARLHELGCGTGAHSARCVRSTSHVARTFSVLTYVLCEPGGLAVQARVSVL